jgi:hypothetical protein
LGVGRVIGLRASPRFAFAFRTSLFALRAPISTIDFVTLGIRMAVADLFAFVITGIAVVFSGFALVVTGMAVVFSGFAFVITGMAVVFSGFALVVTGMAAVFIRFTLVLTRSAFGFGVVALPAFVLSALRLLALLPVRVMGSVTIAGAQCVAVGFVSGPGGLWNRQRGPRVGISRWSVADRHALLARLALGQGS